MAIALPAHNGGRYLRQALEALCVQSFHEFSVVALDDGSSDETPEILHEFAARDARIHPIRQDTPRGLAGAWREAARLADERFRPTYLAWYSDHDWVAPDWLSVLVETMEAEPGVSLCHPVVMKVTPGGEESGSVDVSMDTGHLGVADRLAHVVGSTMGAGDAVYGLFRTSVLRHCDYFPHEVLPDRLVVLMAALHGQIRHLPTTLRWRRITREAVAVQDLIERQTLTLFSPGQAPVLPCLSHATFFLRQMGRQRWSAGVAEAAGLLAGLHLNRSLEKYEVQLVQELSANGGGDLYAGFVSGALAQAVAARERQTSLRRLKKAEARGDTFEQALIESRRLEAEARLALKHREAELRTGQHRQHELEAALTVARAERDAQQMAAGDLQHRLEEAMVRCDGFERRLVTLEAEQVVDRQAIAQRTADLEALVEAHRSLREQARVSQTRLGKALARGDEFERQVVTMNAQLKADRKAIDRMVADVQNLQGRLAVEKEGRLHALAEAAAARAQYEASMLEGTVLAGQTAELRTTLDATTDQLRVLSEALARERQARAELAERYRWARIGGWPGLLLRLLVLGFRRRGAASAE